jgi:hypothetical protein
MKRIFLTLILTFWLGGIILAQDNWTPLFNGKNLKGWKQLNGKAKYEVRDSAIVGTTVYDTPNSFLVTEKIYGNFIFEFEFKLEGHLNSGVQFRSESKKDYRDGKVHGYQFEIDPGERAWTGGIFDESRRGWLYPLTKNNDTRSAYKSDAWNHGRIEAIGNSIKTYVNGILCTDLIDDATASGFIGLQVHQVKDPARAGLSVLWRNLRICTDNLEEERKKNLPLIAQVNGIDNTISEREKEEGWKLIFDGKSSEGWKGAVSDPFPDKVWVIEEGMLKVLKSSERSGGIITDKKYGNFELLVDFRMTSGANSGIKYFVNKNETTGEFATIGCEYQILDDRLHPDAEKGVKGNRKLGSLYDLIPAREDKPYWSNTFNHAKIVVRGNHVEHWLNDVKILEYERNTDIWQALVNYSKFSGIPNFGNAEEGNIYLQDHGDEVCFKNIKIREL